MQINHAVLQIFDFISSLAVYSEHELDLGEATAQEFITAHVSKAFKDPGVRTGFLSPDSLWGKHIKAYGEGTESLPTVGKELCEQLFTFMKQSTDPVVMDAIVCEAQGEERYFCLLLCRAQDGYTHQLFSEEDGTLTTELVTNRAILPNPSQKVYAFCAVNMDSLAVRLFEPKGEYDGEVVYFIGDKVLQIGTNQSSRDTVNTVRKIVDKVAKAHESDGVEQLAMTRSIISKNAEVSDTINPEKIVEEVFADNPIQIEAAKQELADRDMLRPLPVNREFATKVGEKHKIKTDTGIEINFPVEYMSNRDFIEILTNPDGTLRIELKNISKITNK